MRIPFRRKLRPAEDSPAPAAPPPGGEAAAQETEDTMPATANPSAAATTPAPAHFASHNGRLAGSLRTQIGSSDLRAERLVRQLRCQLDDLRERVDGRAVPAEMTLVDIAAVAADPEAAAELPNALLVRALIESHRRAQELEERLAGQRSELGALSARIHEMDTEGAFARGRLQTLEDVIAALHSNLEDLRLVRDAARPLPLAPGPRALRSSEQAPMESLPGVEEA
ncbi:MAG: hypothetical protein DYG91_10615 [Chloroflexi bacterium CFX7]|nr:hypothetical protein [Chloroflexi bacterium CFX7]